MRKKIFTIVLVVLLMMIGGCSKKEAAVVHETAVDESNTEFIATAHPVEVNSEKEFIETGENLSYQGEDLSYNYIYEDYIFARFKDFLSVRKTGQENESVIISGNKFVLSENNMIWYVTELERKIASISIEKLDFTKDFAEEDAVIGKSYDLYDEDVGEYPVFKYDDFLEVKGKTLICGYEIPYTVLLDGNEIFAIENGDEIDNEKMPFKIKQMAYTNKNYDDVLRVTYLSDTNVIGVLEFSEYGIYNNIIDSSENHKELLYRDGDTIVYTQGCWAVYKKDGKTIASDGGLVCDMDSLPYKGMDFGDSYGIGKGSADSAAIFIRVDIKDYDLSDEELIQKYVVK